MSGSAVHDLVELNSGQLICLPSLWLQQLELAKAAYQLTPSWLDPQMLSKLSSSSVLGWSCSWTSLAQPEAQYASLGPL